MTYQYPDNTQNYQQQYPPSDNVPQLSTAPSIMPYPGPEQQGPPPIIPTEEQSSYTYTDPYSQQQQQQYFPTPVPPPSNQNNQLTSYNSPPEASYSNDQY